jgi:hypothetical protein
MTFLQLCQRAAVEAGVASGTAIASALPTVTGATGSLGRIVGWVSDSYSDILMDNDEWDFMRSSVLLGQGASFQTVAAPPPGLGQTSYPLGTGPGTVGVAPDAFGKWDRETFRCFPTAVGFRGEMFLDEIPFDVWRDSYELGAMRTVQTRPVVVAVGPDLSLCLGPPPNDQYTITADYWMAPVDLVNDFDVPVFPTRFHMLPVYRTLIKAGQYEAASELVQRGTEENAGMYAQLQALRAPTIGFGGALA